MASAKSTELSFLAGGGEMARCIREFDWQTTPLGSPENWPHSLKTIVQVMLNSRYPMFVWWGPEFINIYNDAYAPILGKRHPDALGRMASEVWSEIWPTVGPQAETVLRDGRPNWFEELPLIMERNKFLEEGYFTYSYSPVPDSDDRVGGVFCACTEETQRVIGRRRLRTLRALGKNVARAKSTEQVLHVAAATLSENLYDLPFVLFYLLAPDQQKAKLVGRTGLEPGLPASPEEIDLDSEDEGWPMWEVLSTKGGVEVTNLWERFGSVPGGAWPESPKRAIVLPMPRPGQGQLAGFIVVGLSSRLEFNDDYRGFLDLMAGHVADAVASARAYDEERKRAEELADLDRAKTAFFSNVSHEFRTPLTLMLAPVEDLLARSHTDLSPSAKEQLDLVYRNGFRLLRLVNTLLDFSRIEAGRVQAIYESTDLAAFTSELASVFRAATQRAGLELVVDCPALPEPVYVDRSMWEKIVLNLISNAFKFTFEGTIEVKLGIGEAVPACAGQMEEEVHPVPHALLTVRDTGVGIPAAEIPRLFERFHRIETSRSRTHEGSGIGLALVQELVRLHGGTVRAESQPGTGTTFFVAVPFGRNHLTAEQVSAERSNASTAGAAPFVEEALRWLPDDTAKLHEVPTSPQLVPVTCPRGRKLNDNRLLVLVADDNADMRHYVTRLLTERYEVIAVPDGEAALAAVEERRPDLILSDVMMPRMDGFELLKSLRAEEATRTLPVILLSARAGEESRVEGLNRGADDYLVKPFSARELLARVDSSLKLARARLEASERLREKEERLRFALETSHTGAWDLDLTDHTAFHSPELDQIFGYSESVPRWTYEMFLEHVLPGDRPEVNARFREAIEKKTDWRFETRVRRADGVERWVAVAGRQRQDPETGRLRMAGIVQDITERKRTETTLRESESHFRTMTENAPVMTWMTEPSGSCTFLSQSWYDFTGQTSETALGFGWLRAVHPDDRENARRVFVDANEKADRFQMDYRLRRRDGQYRWSIDAGAPRFGPRGEFMGYIGSVIDITDRKHTEESLRQARDELAQHNEKLERIVAERTGRLRETIQELEAFSYSIAHDMRAPLRSMQGFSEILLTTHAEAFAGAEQDLLRRIANSASRMDRLIQDVLNYSGVMRAELPLETIDVKPLIVGIVDSYPLFTPERAEIKLEGEFPLVRGNQAMLTQIFSNLLANAVKFVDPGVKPRIRIWAQSMPSSNGPESSRVRVLIRDNGIGIAADQHEKIFAIFQRLSKRFEGTGIGLAIVKKAVERLGGKVGVQSQPRKGSTFWIELQSP